MRRVLISNSALPCCSPVDFCAGSITAIAAAHTSGFALYHVGNAHWGDRTSLDTILDWVESAG